jgi:tetratricopeptide (TPR) repeat protein
MPDESNDKTTTASPATIQTFGSGRYVIRRILGEGGQKIVYLVNDEVLGRECALSLLRPDALEGDAVQRFRREAHAMASLGTQANLVAVFDIGEESGKPFLVCEYVPGGDLRRALHDAAGPLELDRATAIASDLAGALALAHDHGIIHRDVKPGNVWLTDQGTAKLGDFGLAAAMDQTRLTVAGTIMGTAAYMSPEQALGGEVDARSDLYALGAVLYEMVTGRPPFLGDDALAVISQHVNTAPVAPSWHNPAVMPALDSLILRLLAKAPGERPESASMVLGELHRICEGTPADGAARGSGSDLQGLAWGDFVGRQEELGQLKNSFENVLSGRGSVVMVAGEPGIGKTRLGQEFGVYAGLRGARVIAGHCYEEASAPYGPFVEAFRHYAKDLEDDTLRAQLGEGAPEITALIPELRRRLPNVEAAPPLDGDGDRLRLFESVTTFINTAANTRPLVLFLEDLHWADKPSLLMLQYFVRGLSAARVLVVGTYRDVDVDGEHPLSGALEALARQQNYRRLALGRLSEANVQDLLASIEPSEEIRAGDQALSSAVYRETEGNPFFMREVLSHLVEEGKLYREGGRWRSSVTDVSDLSIPHSLREVIGRRLSRLGDGCRSMLTTASAMAGGFSWEELRTIGGTNDDTLLDLLDEALTSQLIMELKGGPVVAYSFTHALIRQTLYESLSTPRRNLLHARIAEALERLYASNIESHLAELAHHFFQAASAADASKAGDYVRRAGDWAMAHLAYEDAATHYEQALGLLRRDRGDDSKRYELLAALGAAQMNAGEPDEGRRNIQAAADIAREMADGEGIARCALLFSDPIPEPAVSDAQHIGLLEEALLSLEGSESALHVRVLALLALKLRMSLTPELRERADRLGRRALDEARSMGDDEALLYALQTRHYNVVHAGDLDERLRISNEMVEVADRSMDKFMAYIARTNRAADLLEKGEMVGYGVDVMTTARLADELRQPRLRLDADCVRCARAFFEGRFEEGRSLLDEILKRAARLVGLHLLNLISAVARPCELYVDEKGTQETEVALRTLLEERNQVFFHCRLAYLYCETSRMSEARTEFERVVALGFSELWDSSSLLGTAWAARVCSFLGDAGRAGAIYELLQPFGTRNVANGNEMSFGSVSRYLGLLATTMGRWQDAELHFRYAVEMNARLGMRPWVAHTQHDYGRMLLARDGPGDRVKARELLGSALTTADELGMTLLVERIGELGSTAQ